MVQSRKEQRGWREKARETMHEATVEEALRRYGTENPPFNYRWEHVLAVHTLALKLARLTGADAEVVEAATWLHDVRKGAGEDHPREGAIFAREFLPQTDFPPEKIALVAQAIEDHQGLWREEPLRSLESQVLWDADKLAKLGLTAAFHWLGMALTKAKSATLADLIADVRDADWQEKTVASMHSDPARRAASERMRSFNELWERLERELEGRDLEMGG
ncbi:MAG TPA: HD domain-containing protein [Candidatus Binatia bacterium]|jgi:uncharacterized protein|nr:HD domain-containing protein [Candidatus Binatia bacterium]